MITAQRFSETLAGHVCATSNIPIFIDGDEARWLLRLAIEADVDPEPALRQWHWNLSPAELFACCAGNISGLYLMVARAVEVAAEQERIIPTALKTRARKAVADIRSNIHLYEGQHALLYTARERNRTPYGVDLSLLDNSLLCAIEGLETMWQRRDLGDFGYVFDFAGGACFIDSRFTGSQLRDFIVSTAVQQLRASMGIDP